MKKTAVLLILAALLCSCQPDTEAPISNNYKFSCVTGADTLQTNYGFQVVFGDTLDSTGQYLTDFDIVVFRSNFGAVQQTIEASPDTLLIAGKYCQIMAFYTAAGQTVFINSTFYATKGGRLLFSECAHNGYCTPFLITE